jgi:hypothetical protein
MVWSSCRTCCLIAWILSSLNATDGAFHEGFYLWLGLVSQLMTKELLKCHNSWGKLSSWSCLELHGFRMSDLVLFFYLQLAWLSAPRYIGRGPDTIRLYSHVQHPESGCYADWLRDDWTHHVIQTGNIWPAYVNTKNRICNFANILLKVLYLWNLFSIN